ncbi:MAG: DUF58 domain-containing protein [Myxococcales bacterium]|nr:DUF58 domain-containing protein [Myxococcales bacterium]
MLSQELLAQVRRLQVITRRQVASVMGGAYLSVFRGRGMEFDEVRPYVPGDDVRSIDWNVTARTGEPHVKRYVEEREMTIMLVVDVSSSLEFGSGQKSKREAAAEVAAMLAMAASANGDKTGLVMFHGQAEQFIPPRKGEKHALRVIREVLAPEASLAKSMALPAAAGQAAAANARQSSWWRRLWAALVARRRHAPASRGTDIAAALEFCRRVLPRKTVMFVISDFFDEDYLQVLAHANQKHDVVGVWLTDPREQTMPALGLLALQDAESGQVALVDTAGADFASTYAAGAAAARARLIDAWRARGIDLFEVSAGASVVDPLLRFFRQRAQRRRR